MEPGTRSGHTLTTVDDEIDLARLLIPLVRNVRFLIGVPILGALLFGIGFYLFAPKKYMSVADLVVMPPKFKTEFQESNLNVQYYKTIVESPALLASIERKLVQEGVLDETDRLELGDRIEVKIFTKQRAEDVTLSPIIRLVAYGDSPEQAYRILSEWVNQVNATVERLNTQAKQEAISFIESEFPKQRSQYEQASSDYEAKKNEYARKLDALKQKEKQELDRFDARTMDLLNQLEARRQKERIKLTFDRKKGRRELETRRKQERNQLVAKLEPEVVKSEYKAILEKFSNYRSDLKTIDVEIGSEQEIIKGLQAQLEDTPEKVKLRKRVLGLPSTTEVQNPDYLKVQEKVLDHILALSQLKSRKSNILDNLEKLTNDYETLRERVNDNDRQLQEFDMETSNLLATYDDETTMLLANFDARMGLEKKKLSDERAQKRKQLADDFRDRTDRMESEKTVALSVADSQKAYMENIYKLLAQKYEQAKLAKSEDEVTLKLATKPYRPVRNMPRGTVKRTVIVALLLGLLCVVVIYGREMYVQIKSEL